MMSRTATRMVIAVLFPALGWAEAPVGPESWGPSAGCVLVREAVPDTGDGSLTALQPGRFFRVKEGSMTTGQVTVFIGDNERVVDRRFVLAGENLRCVQKPMCFRPSSRIQTYRVSAGSVREFGHLEPGQGLDVVGGLRSKTGSPFIALRLTSEENVLVRESGGSLHEGSCSDQRPQAVEASAPSRWSLIFSVGLTSGKSPDGFAPLLTEIPDRSDVGDLRNPLYTEQPRGNGRSLDVCARYRSNHWFGLQGCGSYEQYSIRTHGKKNPSVGVGISYDSLEGTSRVDRVDLFGFSGSVYVNASPSERHGVFLGAGVRSDYVMSEQARFDYLTGSIFKATEVSEAVGPKGIRTLPFAFVEYENVFRGSVRSFNLGISMDAWSQSSLYFGFSL